MRELKASTTQRIARVKKSWHGPRIRYRYSPKPLKRIAEPVLFFLIDGTLCSVTVRIPVYGYHYPTLSKEDRHALWWQARIGLWRRLGLMTRRRSTDQSARSKAPGLIPKIV